MSDTNQTAIELHAQAYFALKALQDHLKEVVAPHMSIRSDDDQYDDPELWWASPALDDVAELVTKLDNVFITLERG